MFLSLSEHCNSKFIGRPSWLVIIIFLLKPCLVNSIKPTSSSKLPRESGKAPLIELDEAPNSPAKSSTRLAKAATPCKSMTWLFLDGGTAKFNSFSIVFSSLRSGFKKISGRRKFSVNPVDIIILANFSQFSTVLSILPSLIFLNN